MSLLKKDLAHFSLPTTVGRKKCEVQELTSVVDEIGGKYRLINFC